MKKNEYTSDELIAAIKATFPSLQARPGIEFSKDYPGSVWTGGEGDMPDGLPIFSYLCDEEEYDGGVHLGFTAWLENRGWYLENYDGQVYLAYPVSSVPKLTDEELQRIDSANHLEREIESGRVIRHPANYCPF